MGCYRCSCCWQEEVQLHEEAPIIPKPEANYTSIHNVIAHKISSNNLYALTTQHSLQLNMMALYLTTCSACSHTQTKGIGKLLCLLSDTIPSYLSAIAIRFEVVRILRHV